MQKGEQTGMTHLLQSPALRENPHCHYADKKTWEKLAVVCINEECECVCAWVSVFKNISVCMRVFVCACVHVCVRVCGRVCMCVHVYVCQLCAAMTAESRR